MSELGHSRQIGNDRERSGSHPGADISLTRRMRRILVALIRWYMLGFAYRFSCVHQALGKAGMISPNGEGD
jgi:hypothetical protein